MSERPPISPRSPRAALEPEQVPPPPKRSERARNPFVVVGNAIITIVLVLLIGTGAAYYYGKQKLEAPGPLQEDKVVNIPARAGMTDIADILQREGVIDNNRWAFIGAVFALKARSELKPGEYPFQKNASLRDVIGTIVDGKVVQHSVTIPEGLTSEQIVARLSDNDIFAGYDPRNPARGHAAAGNLQISARHHARPGDRSACSRRRSASSRKSGSTAIPTFRSSRRSNW